MNLEFTEEQQELRDQARRLLEDRRSVALARAGLEEGLTHADGLWREVAGLGWLGAAIPETAGGLGLSRVFMCGLLEEFGRALAPLPLESLAVVAEALLVAGSAEQQAAWLPRLADGSAIGALAFTEGPGPLVACDWAAEVRGGRLQGVKAPVADGLVADLAIVGARDEAGPGLFLVALDQDGVTREPLATMDPSRPSARLRFAGAAAQRLDGGITCRDAVETILARAAVYAAFLQLGGAQKALEVTRDWTLERQAFGRPIGGFQAVKHRLADLYAQIELARSNAYFAAWALGEESAELPLAGAVARVSASAAFEQAAKDMIHLHGALGVTWESDCQLFYRRARHLALAFGSADEWRDRIASHLGQRVAA